MKLSEIFYSLCLICASAFIFVTYAQTGVDDADLPPMQKEQYSGKATMGSTGTYGGTVSARWDSAEMKFMKGLTTQEQERYLALKDEFIAMRSRLAAIRDSISGLSPEQRKAAIEKLRSEVTARLNAVESQVMSRMSEEQRKALALHKSEIAKKRGEMKRHIDEIRKRIEQRLQ